MNEAAPSSVTLRSDYLEAKVSARGAELVHLRHRSGQDLLWDGDRAWWDKCAPILFPVIGKVNGECIRHLSRSYPMPQHGFASDQLFELQSLTQDSATWLLLANRETLESYPFNFKLSIGYQLNKTSIAVEAAVENIGSEILPFSLGFHPGFRWPMFGLGQRSEYALLLEREETGGIRRNRQGLLSGQRQPNPAEGRTLPLNDGLFEEGAIVFDKLRSSKISLLAAGDRIIDLECQGFPVLGIWTRPGAPFICIEPWHGHADPEGFSGEILDKPGIVLLQPGAPWLTSITISVWPYTPAGRPTDATAARW